MMEVATKTTKDVVDEGDTESGTVEENKPEETRSRS